MSSSPITPEAALDNLQATALSARCHNAFFRQKQLKALHDERTAAEHEWLALAEDLD